ncbi:MAG: glycosyltransferase family 39 protein [Elusimicrobia bacterium]|nr:glycosyltransferase family 39 protein [Elusimicrobiota bacterium]
MIGSSRHYPALLFVLLIATALRVWGIPWGLPSKNGALTSYHPDEAITFYSLERMRRERSLYPGDALFWGSLHTYVIGTLCLTAQAIGLVEIRSRGHLIQNLRQADRLYLLGRLFSIFCDLFSVLLIFRIGKREFGVRAGLLAACLLALAPASIAAGHFVKPDAMLLAMILLCLWCAQNLAENVTARRTWICGLCVGLAAATKYNGGLFLVAPLLVLWERRPRVFRFYLYLLLSALLGFVIGCPSSLLNWKAFLRYQELNWGLARSWDASSSFLGLGAAQMLFYYLPFAAGWPTTLAGLGGTLLAFYRRQGLSRWMGLTALIIFLSVSVPKTWLAIWTFPVLPFLLLFGARLILFLWEYPLRRRQLRALCLTCLLGQAAYAAAFSRLFSVSNPREEASAWLRQHVPSFSRVGIVRSYFWTPPILRRADTPYRVTPGAGNEVGLEEAVKGVLAWHAPPPFFVLSENELRGHPELKTWLQNYKLRAAFAASPRLGPWRFWRRPPPWDFLYIAPQIEIYENRLAFHQHSGL